MIYIPKIGDKVRHTNGTIGNRYREESVDFIGIVRCIHANGDDVGVEFPDLEDGEGHNLDDEIELDKGWYINKDYLEKVNTKITNWKKEVNLK